jgi:hypothetical protein
MVRDTTRLPRCLRWLGVTTACVVAGMTGACSTMDHDRMSTSALAPGKARIVMQRTNEQMHATTPATAKINGTKVAEVAAGATAVVDVAPGPVALSVESWSYPGQYAIPLEVRAGETVRVEIAPRPSSTAGLLGPIGGMIDKDENGNGGAFTVRQVANLEIAPSTNAPAPVATP